MTASTSSMAPSSTSATSSSTPSSISATSSRTRRLALALALNLLLAAGEAIAAALSRSTALWSSAGHDLADAAGITLALVAARLALRAPTSERSFGYHRATILTALANAAVIVAVTVLIVLASVSRIMHPSHANATLMIGVGAAAALVNLGAAAPLAGRTRAKDLNIRATVLHLGGDALAALGVVGAGVVILASRHMEVLDPAVSLAIAVLIAAEAVRLAKASVDVLLESTPHDLDMLELSEVMSATTGVEAVHDLHCWSLSSEVRALSAHVVLSGHPTLEEAQLVGEMVKAAIGQRFEIAHATLELECEPCSDDATICHFEARVPLGGAASR